MNRQEYNRKIYDYLLNNEEFKSKLEHLVKKEQDEWDIMAFFNYLDSIIENHPQQRFGQLFCNYIGGDYRNLAPCELTAWLQEYLFSPGNYDPFFEESHYTYYRLTGDIPENIKKELNEKKGKKVYFKLGNGSTGIGVLTGVCISPWQDEWNWKIDDKKLISANIHLKLL